MQSKAHIQATTRYEGKAYDKITFRIRKDGRDGITRQDIQAAAAARGQSVNEYIRECVTEKITGSIPQGLPEIEREPFYD